MEFGNGHKDTQGEQRVCGRPAATLCRPQHGIATRGTSAGAMQKTARSTTSSCAGMHRRLLFLAR